MALFTDTVTIYQKQADETWIRTVVSGVQWSDKADKMNNNGQISVARYTAITFPSGTFESIKFEPFTDEDAIVFGKVNDKVTIEKGHRISDLLKVHKGGVIQSVNDNSNRDYLKNVKVVLG